MPTENVPNRECAIMPNGGIVEIYHAKVGATPAIAVPRERLEAAIAEMQTIASLTDCMTIKTRCAAAISLLGDTP